MRPDTVIELKTKAAIKLSTDAAPNLSVMRLFDEAGFEVDERATRGCRRGAIQRAVPLEVPKGLFGSLRFSVQQLFIATHAFSRLSCGTKTYAKVF